MAGNLLYNKRLACIIIAVPLTIIGCAPSQEPPAIYENYPNLTTGLSYDKEPNNDYQSNYEYELSYGYEPVYENESSYGYEPNYEYEPGSEYDSISDSESISVPVFADDNYAHNQTIVFDGFIFDQTQAPARHLRFGSGQMWQIDIEIVPGEGWGWYNGCGPVAVYNAALLLGRYYHPAYIIRYLELMGGAVADGIFGLNPFVIEDFFNIRGVEAITHESPEAIDDIIRASQISVLTYMRRNLGAHIVTIYYDEPTGLFSVFNDWTAGSTQSSPGQLRSVEAWLNSEANNIWQTLTVTTLHS